MCIRDRPPIVWEDVSWMRPITVESAVYAQSLTNKPVKGMLTGPVTILNWSFPREEVSLEEQALQIALDVRKEVLALEEHGIGIIQIDEAALKEKVPLRRSDWHGEYLDWAIPSFRLVHSGVRPEDVYKRQVGDQGRLTLGSTGTPNCRLELGSGGLAALPFDGLKCRRKPVA